MQLALYLTLSLPQYLCYFAHREINLLSTKPLLWSVWFRICACLKLKLKLFLRSSIISKGGEEEGGGGTKKVQEGRGLPPLPLKTNRTNTKKLQEIITNNSTYSLHWSYSVHSTIQLDCTSVSLHCLAYMLVGVNWFRLRQVNGRLLLSQSVSLSVSQSVAVVQPGSGEWC